MTAPSHYAVAELPSASRSYVRQLRTIESIQRVESKVVEGQEVEAAGVDVAQGGTVEKPLQVMPGVLLQTQDNPKIVKATKNAKDEREKKMAISAQVSPPQALTNGVQLTNGGSTLPNGTYVNGMPADHIESKPQLANGIEKLINGQLPPEIEHITYGYIPLSRLISRLAQETFNNLTDVIDEISTTGAAEATSNSSFPSNQINGNRGVDSRNSDILKRQRMLEWAQQRRDDFIKILVLSQWSRQAEQVGKCIDLNVWLGTQRRTYNDAVAWVGEFKRVVEHTKLPNPDLKTALEALSLGKASWLPDLNYLPPKKLTASELLHALRRINTLLSIRLNLHQTIPLPLRNFSIASGRATFRVENEFEVDLSIADEDYSSQLFFVDFRCLFSPAASELPAGRLRDQIEFKVNDVLKRDGLAGCFDFLHDLVLTHKVSILRHQAYEMVRGHWSDHLKVEAVHRSLVVQYWIQRSGGKNWIEIGIRRGKPKTTLGSASTPSIPQISLRWFRAGKEVADVAINLGLGDLSLTGILDQITAMHTTFILKATTAKLRAGSVYSERLLKLKQSSSAKQPMDAFLFVQLTRKRAIKVVQEPVTGRFAILPPSHLNNRTEWELNKSSTPAIEASHHIAMLRCVTAQEEFDVHARSSGWEPVRSLKLDRETTHRYFSPDTLRISLFRKKSWSHDWVLAFTTGLMGDATWIVQTAERKRATDLPDMGSGHGLTIRVASKIPGAGIRCLLVDPSFTNLARIERAAVGMISQYLDTRQLTMNGIPYRLEPSTTAGPGIRSSTLQIYHPPSKSSEALRATSGMHVPWRNNIISLDYHGIDAPSSSGIHVAAARMQKALSDIRALTSTLTSTLVFHPQASAFALRLTTPVGTATVPLLFHRLSTIERLIQFLTTIRRHKLPCNILSLTRLSFTYSSPPPLAAIIDFSPDTPMRLLFSAPSPHLRIQDALTTILRSPSGGLAQVLIHLRITSPLLQQLSALEAAHSNDSEPVDILPRSAEWYELRYRNPRGRIDILLRQGPERVQWFVRHLPAAGKNVVLESGMKALLGERGVGWQGLRTGIVASVKGVGELLRRIDEVFRDAREEAPEIASNGVKEETKQSALNPRKRKAEDEGVVVLD